MIEVGETSKRQVTELNHELYNQAVRVMEAEGCKHYYHIGWQDVGNFIDWLEENYTLEKKDGR